MSVGLAAAAMLQTCYTVLFLAILIPLHYSLKRTILVLSGVTTILCIVVVIMVATCGTLFLMDYGFYILCPPLFFTFRLLSKATGIRFVFVLATALILHRILCVLLLAFRLWSGGFTPLYFMLNVIGFSLLLVGGHFIRIDYHKVVFAYRFEFLSLTAILLLLYGMVVDFSPITTEGTLDLDQLAVALILDLLVVLLFVYIGVSFHSLSKYCDKAQETLSLSLQVEEARNQISLLRGTQEKVAYYRHDLRHHLILIEHFLDQNELEKLRNYMNEVRRDLDQDTPKLFCQNEAANLLLLSFSAKAREAGVQLEADVQIPYSLPISNPELCTLMSNALENAIAAAQEMPGEKAVYCMMRQSDGKLLLSVENPCTWEVPMENGIPISCRKGHGFGVKSMVSIVKKYGGLSSFESKGGAFTVRIVL